MKHIHLTILALLLSFASFAVLGPISGSSQVCVGSTTTLSNTTTGGIWSSSAGSIASVGFSSGVVTGASAGTVTITYTVGSSFVTMAMTVNALPPLDTVSGGGGYCVGGPGAHVYLNNSATGINYRLYRSGVPVGAPVAGTGTTLDFGLFTATGTYTVIATNPTTLCTRNMYGSTSITINPLPTVYTLYTPGSGTICAGSATHLYLSGSSFGVGYQLFYGTAAMGSTLAGTGTTLDFGPITIPGTYSVVATDWATGCSSVMSPSVTLSISAAPGPIVGPSGVCAGSTVTLTDTTVVGTWSSSSPSVATIGTSGIVTGVTTGTTTISFTGITGCSSTMAFSVVNLVAPITGSAAVCTGQFSTLNDASLGGTWISTNPAVATVGSASGIVSGITAGTTTISYTLAGSCGGVSTIVTVNSSPSPITGITSVCAGGTSSLSDATPGGTWSSSNTAVATVGSLGVVSSIAGGSATISYTLTNGCKSSVIMSVDPPPVITGLSTVCVSNTITLTTSIAGSWSSSNPFCASVSGSGVVTGVAPGTAVITCNSFSTGCVSNHTVAVTSGCSGTPAAGVAHAATTYNCGGNPDLLYLTGASTACGVGFQWQYSTDSIWWLDVSGATNDSFIMQPQVSTYYRCKATCYTSGLSALSTPVHVLVYNTITSHTTITSPSFFCNGPDYSITTCGIQPGANIKTYYGDGTWDSTLITGYYLGYAPTTHINHTYNAAGTYTVKQVLCYGTTRQDSVTFSYSYNYCRTLPVFFYFDANNNCLNDDNSNLYHPITTEVDSNGIAIDTITATNGFYYSALGGPGTIYAFKVIGYDAGLHMSCPSTGILYDTITTYYNTYVPRYFGFNCTTGTSFDLSVVANINCARHVATGNIYVGNSYCTVENPVVTMTFSPQYTFSSAYPAPYSVVGNVVTWHLPPTSVYTASGWIPDIYFQLSVPGPFLTAGDTIQTRFSVTPLSGDVVTANNSYTTIDTIRASYDPNGITVKPTGYVIPCTPLEYTIRFENTGNDTARNIAVIDTLPDFVNPHTLRVTNATSVVNLILSKYAGHTIAKFDFPGINLPDSTHHMQCHGAVTFTVKTRSGLTDGNIISNHASIYFDDNLPVLTDTATSIIGISPVVGGNQLCNGGTLVLSNASANGIWSSANTTANVVSGLVTALAPGVDTISYTISNTCGSKVASKTVTINPIVAPAVSLTSNTGMGDTVCTGTVPTFTAVPVNGGPSPTYEWLVNGMPVDTGATYTYAPLPGDTVSVKLTSNLQCATPDTAMASMPLELLTPAAPVDSMIALPGIFITPGTPDTFIAVITSGGPATFQWLLNGLPTGDTGDTFITHTLVDKDSVTCITTSTGVCQLSSFNSFIITVSSVGIRNIAAIGGITVFPNPNRGEFTIKGSLLSPTNEEVQVEITNMMGQLVYSSNTQARNGIINASVSLPDSISNGMYLLTLRSGTDSKVYHFTLEQ